MKRLAVLVVGAVLLSACSTGPIVSDGFKEELPVVDQSTVPETGGESLPEPESPVEDPGEKSVTTAEEPIVLEPDEVEQDSVDPPTADTTTTITAHSVPSDGDVPPELVGSLVDYAATELGVDAADVMVESASPWSWADTAFGCQEDSKLYSQVLTDGYWVVASSGGQVVDMRVSLDGSIFQCNVALPEGREP